MLHRRQAPGRDIHKHFSLAPARSHTIPPSNPQPAPAPSPLQDRAQARNATSRAPHLSLIPPPPPPHPLSPPAPPPPSPPLAPNDAQQAAMQALRANTVTASSKRYKAYGPAAATHAPAQPHRGHLTRTHMRQSTEFSVHILMSARVAVIAVHTPGCVGDGERPAQGRRGVGVAYTAGSCRQWRWGRV